MDGAIPSRQARRQTLYPSGPFYRLGSWAWGRPSCLPRVTQRMYLEPESKLQTKGRAGPVILPKTALMRSRAPQSSFFPLTLLVESPLSRQKGWELQRGVPSANWKDGAGIRAGGIRVNRELALTFRGPRCRGTAGSSCGSPALLLFKKVTDACCWVRRGGGWGICFKPGGWRPELYLELLVCLGLCRRRGQGGVQWRLKTSCLGRASPIPTPCGRELGSKSCPQR